MTKISSSWSAVKKNQKLFLAAIVFPTYREFLCWASIVRLFPLRLDTNFMFWWRPNEPKHGFSWNPWRGMARKTIAISGARRPPAPPLQVFEAAQAGCQPLFVLSLSLSRARRNWPQLRKFGRRRACKSAEDNLQRAAAYVKSWCAPCNSHLMIFWHAARDLYLERLGGRLRHTL